jgi:hypothetical protein
MLIHKCSKKVLPRIPALPHYRQHRPRTVEGADGCSVLLLLLLHHLVFLTIQLSSLVLLLLGTLLVLPLQHLRFFTDRNVRIRKKNDAVTL